MEIVRQMKESICYVIFNPQREDASIDKSGVGGLPYQLPDGTQIMVRVEVLPVDSWSIVSFFSYIQIGNERCRAPEILFNPLLIGLEYPGMLALQPFKVLHCIYSIHCNFCVA